MQRALSLILIGFGLILFYIFSMTFIGSLDGGRFLFFEILLMIVWGIGTAMFLIPGLLMFISDLKRRRVEKEENDK